METNVAVRVAEPRTDDGQIREAIVAAFQRQQANRWRVANTTPTQRIEKLKRLREVILRRKDELFQAMWADFHKPAAEVELTELQTVLTEIQHAIKHVRKWMKPTVVSTPPWLLGTKGMIRYEPKGVVLILAPWNYPFNLFINPLVAAVAAGNCAIMRPSDKVKHTAVFMKSLVEEVFPADEVAVFTGPSSVANIMLELPFDHVFFTGSPNVGKSVMAAAAQHHASVTLELGGQSPTIVDETANVRDAADRIVWGKFVNAGQTCIAPNHVYVHESRLAEFVEAARQAVARSYGESDEARQQSPDFCRIVDTGSHKRLTKLLEDAVQAGAKVETGGKSEAGERYLAPTLLTNVTETNPAMADEIFGPILPILAYRSLDEVLAAIHSRGKPLAMYIFSNNPANIEKLLKNTSAGGGVINNVLLHLANGDLPFGGIGKSGLGNYHGRHGFITFSHERSTLIQKKPALAKMFYPPYTEKVRNMMGFMTKVLSR